VELEGLRLDYPTLRLVAGIEPKSAFMGPEGKAVVARDRFEGKACGIRHLAKNERDVGHPAIVAGMELKGALAGSSIPGSTALPFVISTEAYPDFLLRAAGNGDVCGSP
jgi:hypothetical protein